MTANMKQRGRKEIRPRSLMFQNYYHSIIQLYIPSY